MRLCEDLQEVAVNSFQAVIDAYNVLHTAVNDFELDTKDNKDLSFESSYISDFINQELKDKLINTQDTILDLYYPIDYADDEDDHVKAGERYRTSKETRENIFK